MKNRFIIIAFLIISFLSACSAPQSQSETAGMVIGGVGGGLIGSQFGGGAGTLVTTGIGAVAGGLVGKEVGKNIDNDRKTKRPE